MLQCFLRKIDQLEKYRSAKNSVKLNLLKKLTVKKLTVTMYHRFKCKADCQLNVFKWLLLEGYGLEKPKNYQGVLVNGY